MNQKNIDKKPEAKHNELESKNEKKVLETKFLDKPEVRAEIERQRKIIGEKLRETITTELTHSYKEKIAEIENKAQQKIEEKMKELKEKNALQLEEEKKFLLEKNATALINILDHFNIAVEHIENNQELVNYAKGFRMILQLFNKWLNSIGVEQIPIKPGDHFDFNHMSVIEKIDSHLPNDSVVKVIRHGYKLHNKVIRFANVAVSNAKAKQNSPIVHSIPTIEHTKKQVPPNSVIVKKPIGPNDGFAHNNSFKKMHEEKK